MDAYKRAETLYQEVREEVIHADNKATTLLSVVGLIIGALLAGAIAGDVHPEELDNAVEWMFWLGLALAIVAEGCLCAAILPRATPDKPKEALQYFGHAGQFDTPEELGAALLDAGKDYTRVVHQLFVLSRIAMKKYDLIRFALAYLAAGATLCGCSMLLDHALRR